MSSEIKVVFSSINLAMTPGALRGVSWLGEYARSAGCDGVEYMPMFDKLPGHTPQAIGRAVASNTLDLNSLHATFRENKASNDTSKLPGDPGSAERSLKAQIINGPLGRMILPEVCRSAAVMGGIQREIGKNLPVVLYPQRDVQRDYAQAKAAGSGTYMFQPTDHVARLVGADSIETFDHEMGERRGYDYVLDTFHIRRQYGRGEQGPVSDVSRSVPYLAPNTNALHLSLYRTDIPGEGHIPTEDEARKALRGVYDGQLREMLDTVKSTGEVEYVVIEATANGIGELTGHNSVGDIQKDYADIADGFREYWAAA